MKSWTWIISILLFSVLLAGCASVSIGQKPRNDPPPPATRADDGRPIETIRAENARFRARQAELENSCRQWQAAVDQEERTKKDLKAQKDRAEKDLKEAKKRAKES